MSTSPSREDYLKSVDGLVGHPGHSLRLIAHRDGVDTDGNGRWVDEYHCVDCDCYLELSNA